MKLFQIIPKIIACVFVLVLGSISLTSCKKEKIKIVKLDKKFRLELGECVTVKEEGLHICFDKVIEDSRCPPKSQCIWVGRVILGLIATTETGISQEIQVGDIVFEDTNSIIGDFLIRSVDIRPYNRKKNNIEDEKYKLDLEVIKL